MYTLFATFQSEKAVSKIICGVVTAALWLGAFGIYKGLDNPLEIFPQLFQQFNPFFVVALTPVSMAIFDSLAKRKKEPSAPVKIGLGMFVAAIGYLVMIFASRGQASPAELARLDAALADAVPVHYETPTFFDLSLDRCCGLSVYLPDPSRATLNAFYRTLGWNQAVGLVK